MEIKAPDLGVESAEVSEIMIEVGDVIAKDDNIVLLESDKASFEVPSSAAGKVSSISISVGDSVSEGTVLIELDTNNVSADNGNGNDSDETSDEASEKDADKQADESANQANKEQRSSPAQDNDGQSKPEQNAVATSSQSAQTKTHALPDLGVEEALVAEVMVNVGDTVSADQSILLIESDKASVEVPAPVAGTIEKILVEAGDRVANGQDFIVISGADATDDNNAATSEEDNVSSKQTSQKDASTAESAASKSASDTSARPRQSDPEPELTESQVNEKLSHVYAGPAVRKLARQLGIDITEVNGSALNERIVKEDLFAYVKGRMTTQKASNSHSVAVGSGLPKLPDMSNSEIWGEIHTQDLSRLQKVSIPQLNYNTYLPQVTQFDVSDITETEKLRGEIKGGMKAEGISFTILAFIVKATAYALTRHPRFNSHLSDDNTQLIMRKTVNMGIAVATDDGLIVPVIKNVQDKGLKQIAIEIGELAEKARDKKLGTKDLKGASFTISSQGNLGGTAFTPLVNWPQVGILGVSEASMQPHWNESHQTFEPRLMLPLSLSYDHRVINGADAAVFTRYISQLLADPRRILL